MRQSILSPFVNNTVCGVYLYKLVCGNVAEFLYNLWNYSGFWYTTLLMEIVKEFKGVTKAFVIIICVFLGHL